MAVRLEPGWQKVLEDEFSKDYMKSLKDFLLLEKQQGALVYPKNADIFNAFNFTPFEKVKIVILGQDPYHGPGQAHGLAFSVQKGVAPPPSLKNIFKELQSDIPGFVPPSQGNLIPWAEQGVLLLNATLTVRAAEAGSHQKKGWEAFTNTVIKALSANRNNLVFLLWGRFAQEKALLINQTRHHILTSAHPSPLSAHNGFLGCRHFSKANALLVQHNLAPIDWRLP